MLEIIIMRHGEPELPGFERRIHAREFAQCLEIYNASGLAAASRPDAATRARFANGHLLVASPLKRSLDSAGVFHSRQAVVVDPLFREVDKPYLEIPLLRLHPRAWSYLYIMLWLLGLLHGRPSFRQARRRAVEGAARLAQLAEAHGKVLLVGHGFMNSYLARELKALGWRGPDSPGTRHWQYGIYQKAPG
jgi:broad specificity phosphatase PhoE